MEAKSLVRLSWKSLSYAATTSGFMTTTTTRILHNLSGSVASGQVLALLGASGSGKTVLLECLAGLRTEGITGSISISSSTDQKVRISSVPQTAELYENLTTRESVLFSSQIRNQGRSKSDHVAMVDQLLTSLKLLHTADTLVSRCSGGQRKRVTLAMEMISEPQILLLDEVTSGLDSRICYDLLQLIKQIAVDNKIAVIISIHQPTWPSFLVFDRVLLLSNGRSFYHDEPTAAEPFLTNIDVAFGAEQNPADILMEASCGCFGNEIFSNGMAITSTRSDDEDELSIRVEKSNKSLNNVSTFYLLTLRMTLVFTRNIPLVVMMVLAFFLIVPFTYLVFEEAGSSDACPYTIPATGNISLVQVLMEQSQKAMEVASNVQAFSAFTNAGGMFAGTILLITIPKLIISSRIEVANNWYHPLLLYAAAAVFDALLFLVVFPITNALPYYYLLQNNLEFDRTVLALTPVIFDGFQSQAIVSLIASCLTEHITTSISILMASTFLITAASPVMVKFSNLPDGQYVSSYFSHQRHALDMVILSQYGFDRCGDQEDLMHGMQDTRDYVMNFVQVISNQVQDTLVAVHRANGNYRAMRSHAEIDMISLTAITDTISNTVISPYISRSGRIDALPIVQSDAEDDDYWKGLGYLITMIIMTRIMAGIVFIRQTKK